MQASMQRLLQNSLLHRMSALPATMRAVRVHTPGPKPEAMQFEAAVPLPQLPTPTSVLVKLDYCGVNFIDTYHRTGLYKLPLPFVIGREGAGVVVQSGAESTVPLGSRVVFFAQGSYAEYVAVESKAVSLLPEQVTTRQAAAAFLQGLTAHYLTTSTFALQKGHSCLVHAAAGGTGALIVQMAKILGARVIATVGSEAKVALAREAGADEVINYSTHCFETELMKLTQQQGVDVVYDGVGAATWEKSLHCVKRRGMLVLFGNASGPVPPIDPLVLNAGSKFLTRPTLVDYVVDPQEKAKRSSDLFGWLASGQVKLRIGAEFSLEDAVKAHETLESRKIPGKLVIKCSN